MREDFGLGTLDMREFLTVSARIFATHGSAIGDTLAEKLTLVASNSINLAETPHTDPPCLAETLRLVPAEIAQSLDACNTFFHWRKPGFGTLPAAVANKIEVAEVVGPEAVLLNRQIRFGLLLQQHDHIYPEHHHAAEELYFILAGLADWAAENVEPRTLGAGNFVHHKPWQSHTMSTASEPMLALWGWTGQIDAETYALDREI